MTYGSTHSFVQQEACVITSHASGEEIYRVLMWCTPDSDTGRRSHAVNKAASEDAGTFLYNYPPKKKPIPFL